MSFFSMFPFRSFDLQDNGVTRVITDIFRNVDVDDKLIDQVSAYKSYYINDGERPDIVSNNLYASPDYYWTFFITNDFLKEGLNNWPLNNLEFNKFIEAEYGKYSVMTFVPLALPNQTYNISASFDTDSQIIAYTKLYNTFVGLPLDEKYLPYVYLSAYNAHPEAIASANINRFDSSTLQLWIEKVDNDAFYDKNPSTHVSYYTIEFINPYSEADSAFAGVDALDIEWNEKILQSLATTDPGLYYQYEQLREDTPESFVYPKLTFIPSDIWQNAYDASYNFYKEQDDASKQYVSYYGLMLDHISTLNESYTMQSMKNPNTDYISYVQNEFNVNESHKNITVIDPPYIALFEESFKTTLNSNV